MRLYLPRPPHAEPRAQVQGVRGGGWRLTAKARSRFANPRGEGYQEHLGDDGLPEVGSKLTQGMALWRAVWAPEPLKHFHDGVLPCVMTLAAMCDLFAARGCDEARQRVRSRRTAGCGGASEAYGEVCVWQVDPATGKSKTGMVKSAEDIQVDQVRLMGEAGDKPLMRVGIKLRYDRRPIIGDKFSSRHGQKGVLSTLWPAHNMPFSENGIIPDVIINPNAFPSRMTIGMLIESMAGKAGAMHGYFPDSTPFRFDEDNRAVDYFGHQLKEAGARV